MKHNYPAQLKSGILDQNPTLVQLLGMCPTLATTTSLSNAFGMGMAATAVLICSNVFISLLRKFIPKQVRIAAYIVIVSGFVTAVELLMRTYLVSLYRSLGLFIPLIVVNCIILARAEAFASKHGVGASAVDGLGMGLGFTLAITFMGAIRELFGNGSVFGLTVFGAGFQPMLLLILPAGGFIVFGLLLGGINAISARIAKKKEVSRNE